MGFKNLFQQDSYSRIEEISYHKIQNAKRCDFLLVVYSNETMSIKLAERRFVVTPDSFTEGEAWLQFFETIPAGGNVTEQAYLYIKSLGIFNGMEDV
jgi:hypothetical protein